jgi:hypothetical protein
MAQTSMWKSLLLRLDQIEGALASDPHLLERRGHAICTIPQCGVMRRGCNHISGTFDYAHAQDACQDADADAHTDPMW